MKSAFMASSFLLRFAESWEAENGKNGNIVAEVASAYIDGRVLRPRGD
jgi:hypothetical protein